MPQTVFVTMGEWEGRYMRMEDEMAEQAIADGWAREGEAEPPPDPDNPNPVGDPNAEVPDSLLEFESGPEPEDEWDQSREYDSTPTPKAKKKKTARKSH